MVTGACAVPNTDKAVQGTSKTELGSVAMVNKELIICMKRRVTYCHLLIQW